MYQRLLGFEKKKKKKTRSNLKNKSLTRTFWANSFFGVFYFYF